MGSAKRGGLRTTRLVRCARTLVVVKRHLNKTGIRTFDDSAIVNQTAHAADRVSATAKAELNRPGFVRELVS